MQRKITISLIGSEVEFQTSRSSGPGGQNVNKTNSKVTLRFHIGNSSILTAEEKEIILSKIASRLTSEGELIISSQEKRSQLQNKEDAIQKFEQVLQKAFVKKKARKATKPSKSSVQKRIDGKKQQADKKKWRKKLE